MTINVAVAVTTAPSEIKQLKWASTRTRCDLHSGGCGRKPFYVNIQYSNFRACKLLVNLPLHSNFIPLFRILISRNKILDIVNSNEFHQGLDEARAPFNHFNYEINICCNQYTFLYSKYISIQIAVLFILLTVCFITVLISSIESINHFGL